MGECGLSLGRCGFTLEGHGLRLSGQPASSSAHEFVKQLSSGFPQHGLLQQKQAVD